MRFAIGRVVIAAMEVDAVDQLVTQTNGTTKFIDNIGSSDRSNGFPNAVDL